MRAQPRISVAPRRKPLGRDRRRWRRLASRTGPEALLAALPSFPRPVLERTAQAIIDQLDEMDGYGEAELNGDECDSNYAEDDFAQFEPDGPGCPISDPAGVEEDFYNR